MPTNEQLKSLRETLGMVLEVGGNSLTIGKHKIPKKFFNQSSHISKVEGKLQVFQVVFRYLFLSFLSDGSQVGRKKGEPFGMAFPLLKFLDALLPAQHVATANAR